MDTQPNFNPVPSQPVPPIGGPIPSSPMPPSPAATPPKKGGSSPKSILYALLIVLMALAAGFIYWRENQKVNDLKTANQNLNSQVQSDKTQISNLTIPSGSQMSPQCVSVNNSASLLAPLSTQPVGGYFFYALVCKGDDTTKPKLLAFKVNADGSKKFVYGASGNEPWCVPKSTITNAASVAQTLGLKVCTQS